ncbi:hypothetical protein [Psychrobacillus lasiicapitis]|uniref:Uncharacterized protein n=1 Tax=Psychrobacillus lasiicapitis TaxID=1636719 RepID=A0A544TAH0_9BACI|nr:hypothetical protein [Psychrobacillus lasiicapitis]TQR14453.1 hypothetical protein FG382_08335 [Psychrobacillus lasiicapitis]GGA31217.1 hypothetical protein GCM10011384_20880 [Psychrobacillus lasiicapitis]
MGTLQTELVEKGIKQATRGELVNPNTKTSKKGKERYSRREIEELMGCNRQTYIRVSGAIRNKR